MRLLSIIYVIFALAVLASCESRHAESPPPKSTYRTPWQSDKPLPAWVADPTQQGKRIAAYSSADRQFGEGRASQHERAMLGARQELARMLSVRIQGVVKDYAAESGSGQTQFFQQVSRQIADSSVSGSYQADEWSNEKSEELFVLVVLDPAMAKHMTTALAEAVQAGGSGDATLDAHLRAKAGSDAGFAELDRLLEKQFAK